MPFQYASLAKLLYGEDVQVFTYQDYLYELLAGYDTSEKPVTEQQWEMICDIQGKRRLEYASSTKAAVEYRLREEK